MNKPFPQDTLSSRLLPWYDQNKRSFPWRQSIQGTHPDPYHVFLSEIMLQQTTVTTVIPYFLNFIKKWPTLTELAKTSLDEILHAWQGLGYYARARNMHKAAQIITAQYRGRIPTSAKDLLELPGIGSYTAAAIQSIAFDVTAAPVDANIERILGRLYAINTPLPKAKKEIQDLALLHTPSTRVGCYVQGLMDLGSTVCLSTKPICTLCPFQEICLAYQKGEAEEYPKRLPKKEKPTRHAFVFYIENEGGQILLEKRAPKGLLGGLISFPTTTWELKKVPFEEAYSSLPFKDFLSDLSFFTQPVKHTFTHFHLFLYPIKAKINALNTLPQNELFWEKRENFSSLAFPTLMKKVILTFLPDKE